jgi:hypothetical protein
MKLLNTILLIFLASFSWTQWNYVGSSNDVQPSLYGVKSVGDKIYVYGPTVARDSVPVFVQLHCSEFDFNGNKIFDTLIGTTQSSYTAFTQTQYTFGRFSNIFVNKKYPILGNTYNQKIGIILDTNYAIKEIPIYANLLEYDYNYGTKFRQIEDNHFIVITSLVYPDDNFSESHLYFRIIDSTGAVIQENVIEMINRQFYCTDWIEHGDYYYLTVTRTQVSGVFGAPDLSKAMVIQLNKSDLSVVKQYVHPGFKHAFTSIIVDQEGNVLVGGATLLELNEQGSDYYDQKIFVRLDSELNFVWEKLFGTKFYHMHPKYFEPFDDTTFIGMGNDIYIDENLKENTVIHLFRANFDGELLWERKYHSLLNNVYSTFNEAFNFKILDGGFLICGRAIGNFSQINRGLLLYANCLGFIGPPQAALAHEYLENYQLNFTNNSTEAGSFTWIFDDGSIYQTTEHDGDIQHTFANPDVEHTVTLIAHGCNGEADTVIYTIPIHPDFLPEDPDAEVIVPENGYFAIYPNPAAVGNLIQVVLNKQTQAQALSLEFNNNAGQLTRRYDMPNESGIYMIDNDFAQGLYHVSLIVDGKVVARKKLVVGG